MRSRRREAGFSSLLAVFFVTLFGVLAIAFAGLSTMNMRMAVSHRDITASQAAAESGLAYMHSLVCHYLVTASEKTFERDVTETDAYTQFDNFYDYLYATVADTVFGAGGGLGTVKDISEGTRAGHAVTLSGLALAGDDPVVVRRAGAAVV